MQSHKQNASNFKSSTTVQQKKNMHDRYFTYIHRISSINFQILLSIYTSREIQARKYKEDLPYR